ncbi:MAG: DUF4258 domain-containing protein [Rhodocyclaceae bacterium]|nr:DUF4258 domain-containing protein [Rhodocyclaceae bacterium]MBK6908589.1 DUF4258 domain-containing protein [Rhodocyclaceae bacterium]
MHTPCSAIAYSRHALERMFERAIAPQTVARLLAEGEIIAEYPDDRPHPSVLILGFDGQRPIHIVVAQEASTACCVVVTVYPPDATLWDEAFKIRRAK